MKQNGVYSVSQLNEEIKSTLEHNSNFKNIFVSGEISNFKPHSSGHCYLTLKDADCSVSAVMFRFDALKLRFKLENGMKVIARGRISTFVKNGQVQFYIADMMLEGEGALSIEFEKLKKKLYNEGLFDTEHKKPLPKYPQTIAIITSATGAAIHDMVRILQRRWSMAKIEIFPSLVQGNDAPQSLCNALQLVIERRTADVIIIGRGGGSIEDLWAFNNENLARAIYNCPIPIVSAVGHEPDVTIADFVADMRAPTPSGGAELITPEKEQILENIYYIQNDISKNFEKHLNELNKELLFLDKRLEHRAPIKIIENDRIKLEHYKKIMNLNSPAVLASSMRVKLDNLNNNFKKSQIRKLDNNKYNLMKNIASLDALSPLKVLTRGYSVTSNAKGKTIINSGELSKGETINIKFAEGSAICNVVDTLK